MEKHADIIELAWQAEHAPRGLPGWYWISLDIADWTILKAGFAFGDDGNVYEL